MKNPLANSIGRSSVRIALPTPFGPHGQGAGLMSPLRRQLTWSLLLASVGGRARAAQGKPGVEVWKGPVCGCCKDWVKHLESHGFQVKTHDKGNSEARARLGMPVRYAACHTAEVGGYAIEGHVPSREIDRLLKERPVAIGLSVPAMPRGSPGMAGPEVGEQPDPYDVLLVLRDGGVRVYQSYA